MKYTVTKKNIFNTLNEVILYGVILLVIIIYLWTEFNPKEYGNTIFLVYGLLIFFYLVVVFIPVIVLFFNYYKQNKDDVVIFKENEIIINNQLIKVLDIKQVDIFANKMHFKGQVGKLPHQDNFYYIELILKNNSVYILTSLLSHNIDKELKDKFHYLLYSENVKTYPLIK